jgi:hypothetical protein
MTDFRVSTNLTREAVETEVLRLCSVYLRGTDLLPFQKELSIYSPWKAMDFLTLICGVEDTFDFCSAPGEVRALETAGDLVALVQHHLEYLWTPKK